MEVEIMALCDAATESGGKLNILGAFDRINARQFPAVHSHCAVTVRMRFDRNEEGQHQVRLNFVDADGKSVMPPLEGKIGIKFPGNVHSVCANMILNMNRIKFDQEGQYAIDLTVDGRHEKSLPVNVIYIPGKKGNEGKQ